MQQLGRSQITLDSATTGQPDPEATQYHRGYFDAVVNYVLPDRPSDDELLEIISRPIQGIFNSRGDTKTFHRGQTAAKAVLDALRAKGVL